MSLAAAAHRPLATVRRRCTWTAGSSPTAGAASAARLVGLSRRPLRGAGVRRHEPRSDSRDSTAGWWVWRTSTSRRRAPRWRVSATMPSRDKHDGGGSSCSGGRRRARGHGRSASPRPKRWIDGPPVRGGRRRPGSLAWTEGNSERAAAGRARRRGRARSSRRSRSRATRSTRSSRSRRTAPPPSRFTAGTRRRRGARRPASGGRRLDVARARRRRSFRSSPWTAPAGRAGLVAGVPEDTIAAVRDRPRVRARRRSSTRATSLAVRWQPGRAATCWRLGCTNSYPRARIPARRRLAPGRAVLRPVLSAFAAFPLLAS